MTPEEIKAAIIADEETHLALLRNKRLQVATWYGLIEATEREIAEMVDELKSTDRIDRAVEALSRKGK